MQGSGFLQDLSKAVQKHKPYFTVGQNAFRIYVVHLTLVPADELFEQRCS